MVVFLCVQVFQSAQELLQGYLVHPEIQAQMFAYLFFFSNVSLLNQLMDKGKKKKKMQSPTLLSIPPPTGFISVRERDSVCALEYMSAF